MAKLESIDRYGVTFKPGTSDAVIELQMAFDCGAPEGRSLHRASGFEGPFEHLRKAIDLIWNTGRQPMLIWNEWSEWLLRVWIETLFNVLPDVDVEVPENPISGPAASWKTTCLGIYCNCFWLSDPVNSKVILSSTTLEGLRARVWQSVNKFYRAAGASFGNPVNYPHPKIQTFKGDDGSGIHGVAVEKGDVDAAIDRVKGRHAPKVLIGVDEGTGALPAMVEACVNLSSGCDRYQFIMLGNACSQYDEHGKLSEPEEGWNSISVESDAWKTRRGGYAIHLNGRKSPNVLAGFKKYPGMTGQEDLDRIARMYGENSPRFWQECLGFWPPEGLTKTVLSETIIEKFHARDAATWIGESVLGAALDPAFEGGDRRVLRFAKCGLIDSVDKSWVPDGLQFQDANGQLMVVCFTDVLSLKVDVTSSDEPLDYQIVRQVREECKARGVEPKWFGMDTTGAGGRLASIFKREWSWDFLEVSFAGNPSSQPISATNPRPGTEEYVNRVSELWYQFRYAVERGQIRGLDVDTAKEFCQRYYEMQGSRIVVESKIKMKARMGRSPDLADAAVIMWELFRVRKPELAGGDKTSKDTRWKEFREKMNVFDEKEAYAELNWG